MPSPFGLARTLLGKTGHFRLAAFGLSGNERVKLYSRFCVEDKANIHGLISVPNDTNCYAYF